MPTVYFTPKNIINLKHEEDIERYKTDLLTKTNSKIFNAKMFQFTSDRGIDTVLIDNMDDYTKCTNTVKTFDYKYYANWEYINYTHDTEPIEDYKNYIYFDDYRKRFILGYKSGGTNKITFDYSTEFSQLITTEKYPVWTNKLGDDEYYMYPFISNIYFLIDTGVEDDNPNHPNIAIYLNMNDRQNSIELFSDKMITLDAVPGNLKANGLPTTFELSIVNELNKIVYIDNIGLALEVQYHKVLKV